MISKADYKGLCSEIIANKVLSSTTPEDASWNAAMTKALHFIRKYHEGTGLFQVRKSTSRSGTYFARDKLVDTINKAIRAGEEI